MRDYGDGVKPKIQIKIYHMARKINEMKFYCQWCNAEKQTESGMCDRCYRFPQKAIDEAFKDRKWKIAPPWKPETTFQLPMSLALRIVNALEDYKNLNGQGFDSDIQTWIDYVHQVDPTQK